ncbi:hypothetical protein KAR91_54805 [Candidatus Pacearchaeota archaeon]|nr:hypothetical protein [Candidatus Pacearchaeota archaeon]
MNAIVIDGRKLTQKQVIDKAMKILGVQEIEEDFGPEPDDHGFFLAGNALSKYHVASVMEGMYVISHQSMTPEQTQVMVKKYIKENL